MARLFFNDKKNRDESMFFWFCGENKGRQIYQNLLQKFDQVLANASVSDA